MESKIEKILKTGKRMDKGLYFLLEQVLIGGRLDYYELYIKLALEKGYIITSYIDYLENYRGTGRKVMILRHDIDSFSKCSRQMFDIERSYGVKSTWYFRWCTLDKQLIADMVKDGFEVGLHYETLAEYCTATGVNRVTWEDIKKCREILKKEIRLFKEITGIDIKTAASHGHRRNSELQVSNNVLLESQDYRDYGIVSEAYDREFYEKYVDVHIMDTNVLNNYGFAYRTNPIECIMDGQKLIVFLAHPDNWESSFFLSVKMLIKLIIGRYSTNKCREFKRIDIRGLGHEGMHDFKE
ncbi:MAG: hypothetical protein ACOX7R_00700 [Acetivibrionales bacterium]|jgi:hypothetical protein